MPIQSIVNFRSNTDSQVALLLALTCAPILKGSKVANICTISKKNRMRVQKMFDGTKISCRFWEIENDRIILYLYRKGDLEEYLERREISSFLWKNGYDVSSLDKMLCQLADRIWLHADGEMEFPHEIGVFLGYPLADVRGFIDNEGKNSVYVGYWKVYHNVHKALKLFQQYDMEREQTIQEILNGKTISEIAV